MIGEDCRDAVVTEGAGEAADGTYLVGRDSRTVELDGTLTADDTRGEVDEDCLDTVVAAP
jgi:hypothetical protein